MANNIIVGVANVDMYKGSQLIGSAKTLLDSSMALSSSNEEIRGGEGNQLFARYFHTSGLTINLTDIMFKLEWLALQTGSVINNGGDIYTQEEVVLTAGGAGVVVGTPIAVETYGTVGWATVPGKNDWTQVTFSGKGFTVPGAAEGDTYCVKYITSNASSRSITISSSFVPDTIRLVMTGNLYAGDKNTNIASAAQSSTVSGNFQIVIPRFQFDGNQEISMTSSGVATVPLSGSALANESTACDGRGYYAIITETIYNTNWYDNVIDIAVAGGELDIAMAGTTALSVKAIPRTGSAFTVPNSDLTFTSKDTTVATVSADGTVTGVAAGSTAISVVVTGQPALEGIAYVTVSA